MKSPAKTLLKLATALLAISIIACSDNKNTSPTEPESLSPRSQLPEEKGDNITTAEFEQIDFAGVWRRQGFDIKSEIISNTIEGIPPFSTLNEIVISDTYLISAEKVEESQSRIDGCGSDGPIYLNTGTTGNVTISDSSDEDAEGTKYYRLAENHYRIVHASESTYLQYTELLRLSPESGFQHGELQFSLTGFDALPNSELACGGSFHTSQRISDADENDAVTYKESEIELKNTHLVSAPYGSSYILFSFDFLGPVEPGEYDISKPSTLDNKHVALTIQSPELPNKMIATGGTVQIDDIQGFYIRGTFDATIDSGISLKGKFSYDLR